MKQGEAGGWGGAYEAVPRPEPHDRFGVLEDLRRDSRRDAAVLRDCREDGQEKGNGLTSFGERTPEWRAGRPVLAPCLP
jgi:hypothetical protein